ncbi:hypothetical protein CDD81_4397 [Ophiocordyceps australis]|uniref:Uncharacterized protein n=1 Tax=Ophiocordyceps australis TaxID=1399860 RepID=A0A2C5YI79_9HYPO|nr:hypothetical protein CDD81_4397 [Ophiocordyceps australis]
MSQPRDTSSETDPGPESGETRRQQSSGEDADIAQLEERDSPGAETGSCSAPRRRHDHKGEARDDGSEMSSPDASLTDALPTRAGSPGGSVASGAEASPSVPGSVVSSLGSSVLRSVASRAGFNSPTPSFRPFDRRFQARISSASASPRAVSPAFLSAHSRNVSLSTSILLDHADNEASSPPWDVVQWTRLKKLNGQAFSEAGRRNFGSPTCLAVSASIVLGTSKGIILMFDYSQNLKMIIGQGTKAVESGPVTSVAISADHTTIAGGHANGSIFTWDTSRAARPFLSIPHLDTAQSQDQDVDGHVANVSVVHLGFLGTRHTALVSADDRGMAFSHLATRGTGALGRTVKTTRILGRYPTASMPAGKPLKPSTVLAFAPLPLGNVERASDTMGLTAMLTPYLLVIVSTTPVAQTQHKSARPKDVAAHSAMTGCLAWFPAVKLKTPDASARGDVSKVKLVYCWSNVLTVLEVGEIPSQDRDKLPDLKFKARSRWKCDEAIVAVQWLSRSVLILLTISQRLIVLEDDSMRMTEAFDMLQKHIFHADLFSKQLHSLVEQLDEQDPSMHGVVADAFYMSFKAYKGRVFTLGFNEVSLGALSNWADRLIAMMEHGDYIGAIRLATSYYLGDADKLTIGLPQDATARHAVVHDKMMEIVTASLKYAFGRLSSNESHVHDHDLKELSQVCLVACQAAGATNYLFEDVYEWYSNAKASAIFHETLEPYILEEAITVVPPAVIKDMVDYYVSKGWESRLEEIICHMQTTTLDLDQVTHLCKQHGLYDALTYVWNQAIGDYISPMIDLLSLLLPLNNKGDQTGEDGAGEFGSVDALKIFPYLSYSLTGRVYPSGEFMSQETATMAKSQIYWFFFSGQTIAWPKGSNHEFLTRPKGEAQPAFPYLRLILQFDAPSFLSTLNEAFEDSFLNDSPDKQVNGASRVDMAEEQIFGLTINRQYILTILVDVMNPSDFAPEDIIYLDMFIARNLAKFPQYLLLPGSTMSKVLAGLCNYPGAEVADDAQLSAEYLLSVFHPPDMPALILLLRQAGFYRILKRIYRVEKQYGKLVKVYFEDAEDQTSVFDCISDCLRRQSRLNKRQVQDVRQAVQDEARRLLELDAEQAALTLASEETALHRHLTNSAHDRPDLQYAYLKALLEPSKPLDERQEALDGDLVELYVQLMCKFDAQHVSDYIGAVQFANLRLENLLPAMEATGVVDAAVVLMARDGQINKAMERLLKHLLTLESAFHGLLSGSNGIDSYESAQELMRGLQRYVHVGIWLCQGQTKTSRRTSVVDSKQATAKDGLSTDEELWLTLIDACVQVTRRLSPDVHKLDDDEAGDGKLLTLLRSLVQHTFTCLLTATSAQATHGQSGTSKVLTNAGTNVSFLRILRAFLTQAAATSPNLADLRGVLASIFSAYAYEESILRLSNRLLERSLFVNVRQAVELRQRGWRPRTSTCQACGKRVWGPGVAGGAVFEAWEDKEAAQEGAKKQREARATQGVRGESGGMGMGMGMGMDMSKGKGPEVRPVSRPAEPEARREASGNEVALDPLVVFACRHIYHESCLETLQAKQGGGREREYRCPVDG